MSALPPKTKRALGEPRTPLPASRRRDPRTGGLSQVSATGAPALSPRGPAIQVHSGGVRPSPELFRVGETESGGEVPGAGWGGKVRGGKPSHPRLQAEVGKAEESPRPAQHSVGRRPEGLGAWGEAARCPGRPRPAVLPGRGRGGLARGEGRGAAPVRRRTPPACWASGRPHRWLAWAPPGSSCPRPSSSSGTA